MTADLAPLDMAIELSGLGKSYGGTPVVRDVDLRVEPGEFFSLLGPSGCGKTTTLRMMAGFEVPDTGSITMYGRDVTRLPASRRPANLVFQRYELFPHMTVFENVAFGLKVKKVPKSEIGPRVREMLGVTGVEMLEDRRAEQLSGGQQQRVALARALVNRPEVLLLDEPLSALDAKLRRRMQFELKDIQSRLGTTFLYVTHDQEEALLMSDRIGIMNKGRLEQVGTPQEIYERPQTAFVADFIGAINSLDIAVTEIGPDGPCHRSAGSVVGLPAGVEVGATVTVVIRPERIAINAVASGDDQSRARGTVDVVTYVGSTTHYAVSTDIGRLTVSTVTGVSSTDIAEGDSVTLSWPRAALRTVDETATS